MVGFHQEGNLTVWRNYEQVFTCFQESAELYRCFHMSCISKVFLKLRGFQMERPAALIIEKPEVLDILTILFQTFRKSKKVSLTQRRSDVFSAFQDSESRMIFLIAGGSKQCLNIIEEIIELHKSDELFPKSHNRCIVFVFERMIPRKFSGQFETFLIPNINKLDEAVAHQINDYVQLTSSLIVNQMSLIDREFEIYKQSAEYQNAKGTERVIFMAYLIRKIMMEVLFGINEAEVLLQGKLSEVLSGLRICQEFEDNSGLAEIFRNEMYIWQRSNRFSQMYQMSSLVDEEETQKGIFYDENFYYFSEKLFHQINEQIKRFYSHIQIKSALLEEDVLCTNECSKHCFTVKIILHRRDGSLMRTRVLKLKREFIDRVGELDLVTLCESEGQ